MESLAKIITAISSLAWPALFGIIMFKFYVPIKSLIESAKGRKFTIKVAGNELSMEEASEQQRIITSDIQATLVELENRLSNNQTITRESIELPQGRNKRILWIDDLPKNNSYLVASLEEKGHTVDIALDTEAGLRKFRNQTYDIVISDMGRPEDDHAGITLAKKIRGLNSKVPYFIFCGGWAAENLKKEALNSGVTNITSSGTMLISFLPLYRDS